MAEIIYREESYLIIGACFEVYKEKGCGFTEPVYHECLMLEFQRQGIPFVSQPALELEYKGQNSNSFLEPISYASGLSLSSLRHCRTL